MDKSEAVRGADKPTPAHDLDVCGLDGPGISPTCPGCLAERRAAAANPPPISPHPPTLALARRWRAEGVRRRDAEDRAVALCGYGSWTDRGVQVVAAVALAYAEDAADVETDELLARLLLRLQARPEAARALAGLLRAAEGGPHG